MIPVPAAAPPLPSHFRVLGMHLLLEPLQSGKVTVLANMTLGYGELIISGCQFVRSPGGEFAVRLPTRDHHQRVMCRDKAMLDRLAEKLAKMYAAAGGTTAHLPVATASQPKDNH